MSRHSKKIHVALAFGTRPEAIKMAPLCRLLRQHPETFKTTVIVTAQHRSMLDQVLRLFRVRSDADLNLMKKNQTLDDLFSRVMTSLTPVLRARKPDLLLVHGDTLTTCAAAQTAFFLRIPVGHVEAGLRSFDFDNPFPEEANRVITDHLSTLHFPPTAQAKHNLIRERISDRRIFVTGNTVTDALRLALREKHSWTNPQLRKLFTKRDPNHIGASTRMLLVTAHRRENFGAPLEQVFRALRRVVDRFTDTAMIYPVHLNPRVQEAVGRCLRNHPRIHLIDPVDYLDLVNLLKRSYLVITDSGGIQEEAPALGKPVLVLRKVTERPEAVRAGTARVIGVEEEDVYRWVSTLLSNPQTYRRMANAVNPYGDGHAAERTLEAIRYHFGLRAKPPQEFRSVQRRNR